MPSFSTCLTHFISKYFAKKRMKSADQRKTFISPLCTTEFFLCNSNFVCHGGIKMDYFEFDIGNTFTNQVISKVLTPKINDFFF